MSSSTTILKNKNNNNNNKINDEISQAFFCFNVGQFPLIILTIRGHPESMDEMEAFLATWETLYTKSIEMGKRYKLVFDVREGDLNLIRDWYYLRRLGYWLIQMKEKTEQYMDRTAIIVESDSIRKFFHFVFFFYRPVRPWKMFTSIQGICEWVYSEDPGDDVNEIMNESCENDEEQAIYEKYAGIQQ